MCGKMANNVYQKQLEIENIFNINISKKLREA